MSRSDAFITVTCDVCEQEENIELCALAHRGAWDERYVKSRLAEWGWEIDGETDTCDDCVWTREHAKEYPNA